MTPQEKAENLVDNFYNVIGKNYSKGDGFGTQLFEEAKQCALIAVDEMMEVYASACVAMGMSKEDAEKQQSKYLQEVKQEIEKL